MLTHEEWSCCALPASDLEQTEVTVRIGDTKFVSVLRKANSRHFGKGT